MKNMQPSCKAIAILSLAATLSACAVAPASGPTARGIGNISQDSRDGFAIRIVDVDDAVARHLLTQTRKDMFSDSLGEGQAIGATVDRGDVLDISIWEAPPAALFGTVSSDPRMSSSGATARGTSFPEQMVDSDGRIVIPFVGQVQAAGRTPQDIAREITTRLVGKAHQPQAIVRLTRNASSTVTVVGDVNSSARVPLTAQGERILDVLASAGGVRQPVNRTMLRITRGSQTTAMPLEAIIRDPRQNVILQPDDVMTVLFQPFSFIALGATNRNEEIPFEATGITIAQALGRVAGLQDARADVKGVFLFRLENPAALPPGTQAPTRLTPDGKVPVIYRFDMKNPATFFVAQSFPVSDRDVIFVSNAPLADFQKFVNVIYSTLLPVATTLNVTR